MFVTSSTHQKVKNENVRLMTENLRLRLDLSGLTKQWNELVRRINKKGGEAFLDSSVNQPSSQFSNEDIKRLLQLCHPDKHDGKQLAVDMTQKLLKMKK